MRPLRVLQMLPAMQSGGVERSTLEIAEALQKAGHEATVISAGGRLVPKLEAMGARHITLDIGRKSPVTLRHIGALKKLFEGFDIVHARSRIPAWLARFALAGMSSPPHFVTTVHGLNSPSRYSRIMTQGEGVICVSNTVKDYVLQHYPETPAERLKVIPRGIDPAAFPRRASVDVQARQEWAKQWPALAQPGPLLLMPGRGTRLKGHEDAIQLVHELKTQGIPAVLWMPGAEDPARAAYVNELREHADALNVGTQVCITPPVDAIDRAYAASDVVLQLSRKPESFGRTVVEALSTGVPVAGWAHGGVAEVLGAMFPQGAVPCFDAAALSARVSDFLRTPPVVSDVVPYTLAAMQDATLALYANLVD